MSGLISTSAAGCYRGENNMACIEIVNFNVVKMEQTNISHVIGAGQKNERNDVMLIQTLFNLIGFSDVSAKLNFGLSKSDLPEPTGIFDGKTQQAIWEFQKINTRRLHNIDGKIHPASYKNRVLKKGPGGRQMMITLLNLLALEAALMNHSVDLISAIKKLSPKLILAKKAGLALKFNRIVM